MTPAEIAAAEAEMVAFLAANPGIPELVEDELHPDFVAIDPR